MIWTFIIFLILFANYWSDIPDDVYPNATYDTLTIDTYQPLAIIHILILLNRILALSFVIYVYINTPQPVTYTRVSTARKYWIIAGFAFLIFPIIKVGHMLLITPNIYLYTTAIANGFNLIAIIILAYITIRFPEAVLFSHSQLIRALELYDSVQASKSESSTTDIGIDLVTTYLNNIPSDILVKIRNDPQELTT
jgi:hypothetical protein